ncbi:MAG: ROK family protein [Bacteroidales bacterium]|nr:ROK family protein [Bacteroidales bacterium]
MKYNTDSRIVMTLDAGGTNFVFNAVRGNKEILEPLNISATASSVDDVLEVIRKGFEKVRISLPQAPSAISFSFPGPAEYELGIIGDLANLPAFRGGVALGPFLKKHFDLPVFINNDGDLFAYGEAIAGLLPDINEKLEKAGSPKQFASLAGVTFGTGYGGGMVYRGQLFHGDNAAPAEINRMCNKLYPGHSAEDSVSIRGIKRVYAREAGILETDCPEPRDIYEIINGSVPGNKKAAITAFEEMAIVAGNTIADLITLTDGLVVIGGGLAGAWPVYLQRLVDECRIAYTSFAGKELSRLEIDVFNLENPLELEQFIKGDTREIKIPGSSETIKYDPMKRVGIGISRLGTSTAVSVGAYAYALDKLDKKVA